MASISLLFQNGCMVLDVRIERERPLAPSHRGRDELGVDPLVRVALVHDLALASSIVPLLVDVGAANERVRRVAALHHQRVAEVVRADDAGARLVRDLERRDVPARDGT